MQMAKNYIIDNNINFYEELYKSLDEPEPTTEIETCLITNLPLTENYVQLECKHKFNYVPLYNDILIHKKTFNRLERRMLDAREIRCPYCRNIQKTLLPFYKMDGIKEEHGVNFFDETLAVKKTYNSSEYSGYFQGTCAYVGTATISAGENEIIQTVCCKNNQVKKLDLDDKTYCMFHKYQVIKEHQKKEKQKAKDQAKQIAKEAKEQAKQIVQKAKEIVKEAKEQAKKEVKEEKKLTKQKEKQVIPSDKLDDKLSDKLNDKLSENIIIDLTHDDGCTQILKSGVKKGQTCGCKKHQNNLCLRHFNLFEKSSTKEN
jgi:hypothetical protein